MKNVMLAVAALFLCQFYTYAQNNSWTVKSGENINTTLAADVKFHYPQFTEGNVFFKDGTISRASLNYNLLSGEMQFIGSKQDTLAVANEATIKYVVIGSDTFFYDKAFVQLVASNSTAKLAKKETLNVGNIKKAGAYDQMSSASSVTTVSSLNSNDRITKLTEKKEVTVLKETTYYIGDVYNHFLPATKKNFFKLFGKKENALEQYFKDNKVIFNKEEDVKALVSFLGNND